jgi:hypothetical protein
MRQPGCAQQVAEVLEPAQLGQAGTAVAVLGLAEEGHRRAGGSRAAAACERQDVDLVARLVLAAGDDGSPDRADGQACLLRGVSGDPLGGERLEVRPEDRAATVLSAAMIIGPKQAPGAWRGRAPRLVRIRTSPERLARALRTILK